MSNSALINDNIQSLQEIDHLLSQLSDDHYTHIASPYFSASPGHHFRHILDHYLCFLDTNKNQQINYDDRLRNQTIETRRDYAQRIVHSIIEQLKDYNGNDNSQPINVTLTTQLDNQASTATAPVQSTLNRELVFLHSHTIHHLALIAVMLRLMHIDVEDSLGVAPSTLIYEQANAI